MLSERDFNSRCWTAHRVVAYNYEIRKYPDRNFDYDDFIPDFCYPKIDVHATVSWARVDAETLLAVGVRFVGGGSDLTWIPKSGLIKAGRVDDVPKIVLSERGWLPLYLSGCPAFDDDCAVRFDLFIAEKAGRGFSKLEALLEYLGGLPNTVYGYESDYALADSLAGDLPFPKEEVARLSENRGAWEHPARFLPYLVEALGRKNYGYPDWRDEVNDDTDSDFYGDQPS